MTERNSVNLHEALGEVKGRMRAIEQAFKRLSEGEERRHNALLDKLGEIHCNPCEELQKLVVCVAKIKQREATAWKVIVVTATIIGGLVGLTVAILRLVWR